MISVVAARITEALCASNAIEECDRELYQYGFFLILSRIVFFLFTFLVGTLFGVRGESVVFYIMFSLLRSYAGGIHAKTETSCTLWTGISLFLSVAVIYILQSLQCIWIATGLLIYGFTLILLISPLDTQTKPLTEAEKKYYRRVTWCISIFIVAVALICGLFGITNVLYCASQAMILEGLLLIIGRRKKLYRHQIHCETA